MNRLYIPIHSLWLKPPPWVKCCVLDPRYILNVAVLIYLFQHDVSEKTDTLRNDRLTICHSYSDWFTEPLPDIIWLPANAWFCGNFLVTVAY